jgi:DNA-binding protein H-NS
MVENAFLWKQDMSESDDNSKQGLNELQQQLQAQQAAVAKRFEEIARSTELLEQEQAQADALQQQVQVLREQAEAAAAKAASAAAVVAPMTQEEREKNLKHVALIAESDLFDAEWYMEVYPDVAESEKFAKNPAAHYALFGGFEGRNPCPEFHSAFYIRTNADVAKARINPLVHYLRFGRSEGRAFAPPMDDE